MRVNQRGYTELVVLHVLLTLENAGWECPNQLSAQNHLVLRTFTLSYAVESTPSRNTGKYAVYGSFVTPSGLYCQIRRTRL